MFKVCGITGISKIEFFNFPVLVGLKIAVPKFPKYKKNN